jgi:hypothetical protein
VFITIAPRHLHDAYNWPHPKQRGGILPLLAAIALYILPVLGGLGAAAGVAGGIATAVNQAKQAHAVGSGVGQAHQGMRATCDPPHTTFPRGSSTVREYGSCTWLEC